MRKNAKNPAKKIHKKFLREKASGFAMLKFKPKFFYASQHEKLWHKHHKKS